MCNIDVRKFIVILSFVCLAIPSDFLFASSTNGTIDSTNRYARFLDSNYGYIDFGLSAGNVYVTATAVTGYVWSEYAGWINLSPTYGGVTNTNSGVLSGYAWGEHIGWINFNPTTGGVSIDSNGVFSGYAWSQNFGWIVFNCANLSTCSSTDFKVSTDWRHQSSQSQSQNQNTGSGSYSSSPSSPPANTTPPSPPPTETQTVSSQVDHESNPPNLETSIVNPPNTLPPEVEPQNPPPSQNDTSNNQNVLEGVISSIVDGVINNIFGGEGSPAYGVLKNIISQISESYSFAKKTVSDTARQVGEVVKSPEGSVVTKSISTTAAIVAGATSLSTLFLTPLSFTEIGLIPLRLWGLLLAGFGLKKRKRPWGTVYDSVTKQPLDPAYVSLLDSDRREISGSITDLDGRFGFLLAPGKYHIVANKTHYIFPSKKLFGQTSDILYNDLYFGGEIMANVENALIIKNIPMDPENFDWNEFAKGKKNVMKFYSRHSVFATKLSNLIFYIGFIVSLIALIFAPQPYNIIISGVYILLFILRTLGLKPRTHGFLKDKMSGEPLSFALIRVYSGVIGQIKQAVADQYGRYYCLVPPGSYSFTIEKKNADETYTKVYESREINVKNGIIHADITV